MAWSAPMTAVAGATFSAAQFNQFVRDNLLETGPAKISAAGQILVGTGANALAARTPATSLVSTNETTTSSTYADLTTPGPSVTATTGTSALVFLSGLFANSSTGFTLMGFAVSGASTVAAADPSSVGGAWGSSGGRASGAFMVTGLTAGSNVFTAKYRASSSTTGTFIDRKLTVVPL